MPVLDTDATAYEMEIGPDDFWPKRATHDPVSRTWACPAVVDDEGETHEWTADELAAAQARWRETADPDPDNNPDDDHRHDSFLGGLDQ